MKGDIGDAHTLDPHTHIFMFDIGFPPSLQERIAIKFNRSVYAQYLISWRPPKNIIDDWAYDVTYMHHFATSMHGK